MMPIFCPNCAATIFAYMDSCSVCGHTRPKPPVELPKLPDRMYAPFIESDFCALFKSERTFLAALLNAVYGGGEGKS